jgi:hypothetical protein
MRKFHTALVFSFVIPSAALWVGCGESASDKPVMVVPDVPPAEKAKDSMDAYLKANPKAAKGAAPGLAPKQ